MRYQSRRLRLGRSSEPGRVYFITICARNRLPIFADTLRARTASRISDAGDTWGSGAQARSHPKTVAVVRTFPWAFSPHNTRPTAPTFRKPREKTTA
ncbi:hypothetical protein SAMN02800692_3043 [Luteibacter sp. UNC138MFCol5.1]|nr:hypothetical protein SAMN02800692_3043 [Luteibacter sp. UNC138MFCol5.1]